MKERLDQGGHNKLPETVRNKVIRKLEKAKKPTSIHAVANACQLSDQKVRGIARKMGWLGVNSKEEHLTPNREDSESSFVGICC